MRIEYSVYPPPEKVKRVVRVNMELSVAEAVKLREVIGRTVTRNSEEVAVVDALYSVLIRGSQDADL